MNVEQDEIYNEIPSEVLNTNSQNAQQFVKGLIKSLVPAKDYSASNFDRSLLLLNKTSKRKNRIERKKALLTRKQKQQLNLFKCPKDGWNYKELEPLRKIWKSYMLENFRGIYHNLTMAEIQSSDMSNLNIILAKCEYNGAEIKVLRSKNSSLIGLSGTCIIDTKNTFKLVTVDNKCKTVPKADCFFEIDVGNIKLNVYGKYMTVRPTDRSAKKIKSIMIPDL